MHSTLCYNLQFNNPRGGAASSLYTRARKRGQRGQLWAGLTGRSRGLLALGEVCTACSVQNQGDGGIRTVSIGQIRGSEGRATDFDRDFNPIQDHTRDRWLGIAAARNRGRPLPPVALIQVGDHYFVRDGHHRISVARALGQQVIEAAVEIWQVDKPLPWEQQSQAPGRSYARNQEHSRTPSNGSRSALVLRWLSSMLRPAGREAAIQAGG